MLSPVSAVLTPRRRDLLGGFLVARALPAVEKRSIGSFVFFDHMGPAKFAPGKGLDVRPHPHIGLATITYLFEGEIMHRDSLGTEQAIVAGDANWMVAGSEIVHSERTRLELRRAGHVLHGIQAWLALPAAHEQDKPSFKHHPAAKLPTINRGDLNLRLILGAGFGLKSPVKTYGGTVYADVMLTPKASFEIPPEHAERAIYLVSGALVISGQAIEAGSMAGLLPDSSVTVESTANSRLMVLGGEPLDAPRTVWWNFVASRPELLQAAQAEWPAGTGGEFKSKRFKLPPGKSEFTPLPKLK